MITKLYEIAFNLFKRCTNLDHFLPNITGRGRATIIISIKKEECQHEENSIRIGTEFLPAFQDFIGSFLFEKSI